MWQCQQGTYVSELEYRWKTDMLRTGGYDRDYAEFYEFNNIAGNPLLWRRQKVEKICFSFPYFQRAKLRPVPTAHFKYVY